jgi:hypothetical protein
MNSSGFAEQSSRGSPPRTAGPSKVIDRYGQAHYVMVEPHHDEDVIPQGETALLVRREGSLFFALPGCQLAPGAMTHCNSIHQGGSRARIILNVLIYAGIVLLSLLVMGIILTRLYRRATKDVALIRTGFSGEKWF